MQHNFFLFQKTKQKLTGKNRSAVSLTKGLQKIKLLLQSNFKSVSAQLFRFKTVTCFFFSLKKQHHLIFFMVLLNLAIFYIHWHVFTFTGLEIKGNGAL